MRQIIKTGIIFLVGKTTDLYYIKVSPQSFIKVWIAKRQNSLRVLLWKELAQPDGASRAPMTVGTCLDKGIPEKEFCADYGCDKILVMKKILLVLSLVVIVIAIVLAIVLLITSPVDTKIQNTETPLTPNNSQTQISKETNFLEKITPSTDSNITSVLERVNPLDVFKSLQQKVKVGIDTNLKPENSALNNPKQPRVLSVSPERVRNGESVTVTGENFTPTNNSVFLKDGPAQQRFDELSSYDGRTITFVYQPPEIKVMTEAEIRTLPANIVSQIETPLKTASMTLADALKTYSEMGIKSEEEFRTLLENRGQKFEDFYHYFFVRVENSQGSNITPTAILRGLPKMVSDIAEANSPSFKFSKIIKKLKAYVKEIMPTAYAQGGGGQQGGGFFVTVLICTCSFDGWMDFMIDYSGGGSGLWKFTWGSRADAGTSFGFGYWLGGYEQGGETCSVGFRPYCADITGSKFQNPYGASM